MGELEGLSEHARANCAAWNAEASEWVAAGRRHWSQREPNWGNWEIPEAQLRILPDVADRDVIELGCGTAYWSAWLARRGARPVGVDLSERQLATARELQREHALECPLVHASAEPFRCPTRPSTWLSPSTARRSGVTPYAWIPEAHRLLRPGGWLVFLVNGLLAILCSPPTGEPAGERLQLSQFGLHRTTWEGESGIDFHLPHGELIRLLRATGFAVEALHELQAPSGPDDELRFLVTRGWARQWPSEEVWVARRTPE